MNERIKELALQAKLPSYVLEYGTELCLAPHLEKFAELIVRECMEQVSKQPAIPQGWKLVPVVPTIKMVNALADTDPERESVWDAVLAAAPQPPAQPLTLREIGAVCGIF